MDTHVYLDSVREGDYDLSTLRAICPLEGCGRRFASPRALAIHKKTCYHRDPSFRYGLLTSTTPHRCDYGTCRKACTTAQSLIVHKNRHSKQQQFICSVEGCGQVYMSASSLKYHLSTHARFRCDFSGCRWWFTSQDALDSHATIHMRTCVPVGAFPCKVEGCPRSFVSPQALRYHHSTHERLRCTFSGCRQWFVTEEEWMCHEASHTGSPAPSR